MSGSNKFLDKQRRAFRRRNHFAKDLEDLKYRNRIRESKRQHLIDEIHREEIEEAYHFFKEIGLGEKE